MPWRSFLICVLMVTVCLLLLIGMYAFLIYLVMQPFEALLAIVAASLGS